DPDGRLFYRGEDVEVLAGTRTFEEVAEWLWTGAWTPVPAWSVRPGHEGVAALVADALPAGVAPFERLRVAVPVLSARDPDRHDLSRVAVVGTARSLIA